MNGLIRTASGGAGFDRRPFCESLDEPLMNGRFKGDTSFFG